MSDTVIKVENLSKKYILSHQNQEKYTALRDVMANGVRNIGKKILSPFNSQASTLSSHPTTEDFYALNDVSFEIKQGDRVGIIGRNGAGKSTLLKILSRITEPTSGRIEITGRVASLLEVGTGFHPELTGRENIFLNGAILGMSRADIKRKFDEIVAFAEVEKFLDTPVKRYSSGMYVRLAFAVAAHLEPEILIVDEVLAVGDAQFQKKCLGKMEEVGKEGRTVLFVSHNMAAIQALCCSAIYLHQGTLHGMGDVDSQINGYLKNSSISSPGCLSNPLNLNDNLILKKFEFTPNPVRSCEPIDFNIELYSKENVRLDSLVLLIFTAIGTRVAIIDLRQSESAYDIQSNHELEIRGNISQLSLVEGDYRIGLYVSTPSFSENFEEILNLSIEHKYNDKGISPYPSNVRGYVELDSAFNGSIRSIINS